ncbi:Type 1 glutamine amidotransferase-like domain-containing protein [Bacillus sp. ISL-35]|uniref:Type 1 glutamine amidotransferase-like domain-containing protein n=1 Tax=Bacillus sp. ISL-35 TaxID=2819122 RepID=UPI001BEC626C|nr:Type 1 glutamine amidotransferase-like domain-containing protein [Bacillus sp. ISL-35]MBT2680167.1 Type 1 glutamine amidotransferase-like domain-containing protein [Bacillus sp. ISL-35]MBT2704441.1 Type 1 glutamine amidotransferase-like domain-containing protein [Chryseobacterium sp. ISL-80]
MKKLVMLSEVSNNNPALVSRVRELLSSGPFKLAYVPSKTDKERRYFEKGKQELETLGVSDFLYFDVDEEFDERKLEEFKRCDGIFLSGGNTFSFLKNLQERNMLKLIRKMALEGKPLIGVSAGSMIMSNSIKIADFLDENEVKLDRLDGLGLLGFEFMPHWGRLEANPEKLLEYSLHNDEGIYLCNDGDGIVIDNDNIEFYGELHEIRKGQFL